MARIVMKFGGTSMAGIERIRSVAARVRREAEAGIQVLVVVSAMAGETDRLDEFEGARVRSRTDWAIIDKASGRPIRVPAEVIAPFVSAV